MHDGHVGATISCVCLLLSLLLLGPRVAIAIYWLGWPARWDLAFDSFLVPFAGFLFAPWTTLMYVGVAPGGVDGLDFLLLALGVAADVASTGGGGTYGRARARGETLSSTTPRWM